MSATDIWIIFSSMVTIASIIVKITPTKRDDKIFARIMKMVNAVALNSSKLEKL